MIILESFDTNKAYQILNKLSDSELVNLLKATDNNVDDIKNSKSDMIYKIIIILSN